MFRWNTKDKSWQRRKKPLFDKGAIARVHVVPPGPETLELFYFRMLLTVVSGPTSFASLKTHNGTSHET